MLNCVYCSYLIWRCNGVIIDIRYDVVQMFSKRIKLRYLKSTSFQRDKLILYLLLNPAIMRNKILQVIWKKVQVIWKKIQEPKMVRFILTALLILLITLAYHKPLMELYEDYIITPLLKPFESNIGVGLITVVFLLACSWDIVKRWNIRYQFSKYWIGGLCFVTTLLLICRLYSSYEYVFWVGSCAYVDVITFVCFAYVVLALFNCYKKEKAAKDEPIGTLLEDNPIESGEEDVFSLKGEAQKIAKEISARSRAKTCSIAITAPWGGGKSSFLNLIRKQINEDEFEIVYFVPRDSKSVQTIQEDFFSMIACVLAKYDSRCSHIMKDYMASLQLIDNRSIVERLLSLYRIWDKDSLKDSIKESFAALKKRVLVIIDDFDRLSKEEILEVLKLIDGNAAFTNLIFLTAYDKEQVNRVLGDTYQTPDACFVDKFFDVEFAIPFRKYEVISDYIKATLCKQLAANDSEGKNIQRVITDQTSIFEENIPTLRDAKRYINQVVLDFKQISVKLNVTDFLLLQLVKYRNLELYKDIFKQKYLEIENNDSPFENHILCFNEELVKDKYKGQEEPKIFSVLKLLFPKKVDNDENDIDKQAEKRIRERIGFDSYFTYHFPGHWSSDMEELFDLEWPKVKMMIAIWSKSEDKFRGFVRNLYYIRKEGFDNFSFIRYAELVTYSLDKFPESLDYKLFKELIDFHKVEEYVRKYDLNEEVYKSSLLEIIKADDSKLNLIKRLHLDYKQNDLKTEECLIKDKDIWPFMKKKFQEAATDSKTDEQWLKDFLYHCIDDLKPFRTILDQTCLRAYRERIERDPSFYIKKFVFQKEQEYIACEPYFRQIFENNIQAEAFLDICREENLEGSLLAWNFWQLCKNNNYKMIRYRFERSVQKRIDKSLVEEVEMLGKMKQIEKVISEINIELENITPTGRLNSLELLSHKRIEIDNIQLPIALKDKILNEIDHKLDRLSQIEAEQER